MTFSHPTGNANVRAALQGLFNAGILSEFHTAIAAFPGDLLYDMGGLGPLSELRRRTFDPQLKAITKQWPWIEAGRLLASKAGLKKLVTHETGFFSVDAVYRSIDRRCSSRLAAKKDLKAVYAYEDGAYYSFNAAKRLGAQCIYDLPIGYWRAARELMEVERERWPEWNATLVSSLDSPQKLQRKDEELKMADRIFVASSFTARTLGSCPFDLAEIEVIPYGFPQVGPVRDYDAGLKKRPLRLLFVGGLSQRKGIANLFSAVSTLKRDVTLTVVGRKMGGPCPALDGELKRHRWIPSLSHSDILGLMREHDVLVFPSLFEGFGLVISEAMSQGTPVITTDRTAGPDFIRHGENGWVIRAGSTDELRETISSILDDPEIVARAGRAAMETARARPWEVYMSELAHKVEVHLADRK